jgi:hypothetical protein
MKVKNIILACVVALSSTTALADEPPAYLLHLFGDATVVSYNAASRTAGCGKLSNGNIFYLAGDRFLIKAEMEVKLAAAKEQMEKFRKLKASGRAVQKGLDDSTKEVFDIAKELASAQRFCDTISEGRPL